MNEKRKIIADRFFSSDEAPIFVIGSSMLIMWVSSLAILWKMENPVWNDMLQMSFAHILAGRAASIANGTSAELGKALIAFLAVYMDIMVMFIVYPVLVFSYKNLFERQFFKTHMRPFFDQAQRSLMKMRGFKIAGIFFFVWFPLWMTGIIVGAVIGFLLGLRTWVTLLTVALGTTCAVISWVYAYDVFFGWLGDVHPGIPTTVTLIIILILVLLRYRAGKQRRDATQVTEEE